MPELLTLEQLADWLQVSKRLAEQLVEAGCPRVAVSERVYRYRPDVVLTWLESRHAENEALHQQFGAVTAGLHVRRKTKFRQDEAA